MNNADRPITGCGSFFLSDLNDTQTNNGLSKREHYAGLAMQGLIAGSLKGDTRSIDEVASLAVKFADAVLKELSYDRKNN